MFAILSRLQPMIFLLTNRHREQLGLSPLDPAWEVRTLVPGIIIYLDKHCVRKLVESHAAPSGAYKLQEWDYAAPLTPTRQALRHPTEGHRIPLTAAQLRHHYSPVGNSLSLAADLAAGRCTLRAMRHEPLALVAEAEGPFNGAPDDVEALFARATGAPAATPTDVLAFLAQVHGHFLRSA